MPFKPFLKEKGEQFKVFICIFTSSGFIQLHSEGCPGPIYSWHFQEAKMREPVLQRQLTERALCVVCIAGVDDPLWSDG